MDIRRQESLPTTPAKPEVNVSVTDVQASDGDQSPAKQLKGDALTVASANSTVTHSATQITRVIETGRTIKTRIIYDLDDVNEDFFERVNLDQFLDFVADERLIHMPRKGTKWDRVLKAAEYFALQLSTFARAVAPFVPESQNAAHLAIGFCQLLLEVCFFA